MNDKEGKDSAGSRPASDEEVRYLAGKMGVSVKEMRRILAESSKMPEKTEMGPGLSDM
jgi:hypothetical protein